MLTVNELINEAERLPDSEKWLLVKQVLRSLEIRQQKESPTLDWHNFLSETYGSLSDTPIQRWDQGEYEERESIE